ncbi:MAG: hypothetical protein EBR30_25525 [Cytophagia bacterium]|nr:hypothetical protein [Cytophagia bacterium]NBW38320.1 hypothetical protein [Cytophagia bacterium]
MACQQKQQENTLTEENPPAEGFNMDFSDPAAIELADSVMRAQGGRAAWDQTRFISWNFFGRRNLVWDKQEARVRIESLPDSTLYLLDMKTGKGRVRVKGTELTEADTLKTMLERAEKIWINDSYWLVMPFKLKDSGVTLKYLGEDTLQTGGFCNVLQLTFSNVGTTPENKYHVYVDRKDNLVKQWAYFENATQDTASAIWPFDNYKRYGKILLSADRSDDRGPKNVSVSDTLPDALFTDF